MKGACVLQTIPRLDAGGAERTTLEVAEALIAAGGRAIVVSEGGRLETALSELGATLIKLPVASKNILRMRKNAKALEAIIAAEAVDLVHARSRAPAWSALWASRAANKPFVTTYHGTYSATFPGKALYNSVMARGDRVIANSDFIRDHVLKTHPINPHHLITIPRGIDPAVFDPDAVSPDRLGEIWSAVGITEASTRPIVLLPGRLTAWKGHETLIAALAKLKANGAAFTCRLVGDAQGRDAYVARLRAQISRHGLQDTVSIHTHVSDMPALYKAADVVVAPSIEPEAFGRVAVEAQAMRRPVIVSDHGGQRETVLHKQTGWRTPPGEVDALAQAVGEALTLSEAKRAKMGAAGRAYVLERFTLGQLQTATLAVYADLLHSTSSQNDRV